jgi:hypothetical protein
MDEGDKAHVERAEGLQQALFAYHETWEWFLQLPVSRTSEVQLFSEVAQDLVTPSY